MNRAARAKLTAEVSEINCALLRIVVVVIVVTARNGCRVIRASNGNYEIQGDGRETPVRSRSPSGGRISKLPA